MLTGFYVACGFTVSSVLSNKEAQTMSRRTLNATGRKLKEMTKVGEAMAQWGRTQAELRDILSREEAQ
jgi:hypothetical protein